MNQTASFRIASRALRRNPLRTLLTMLGIIIGVAAVVSMVAIGNGAKAQVEAQVASLGQNVVMVLAGTVTSGGSRLGFGSAPTLTAEDLTALRKELTGITGVTPEVRGSAQVIALNQNLNTSVVGVGTEYLEIRSWPLASGSNFNEQDVRIAAKVALVGQTASEALFGDGDPVGQVIRIENAPFVILGLLAPKGASMRGDDQDDVVLVPYTSAMKRVTGATTFRSLMVQVERPELMPDVQEQITSLLRQRHRIGPGNADDFIVRTQDEIANTATATSRVMTALLGAIAGVSLLVGGIGVMNIMLVSVIERTREIGVRLAVGARGTDILLQFLIEAATLGLAGGALGVLMGIGTAAMVSARFGWLTLVSTQSVGLAFFVSAAIGVFFGFYPARKAARLDPIEALRYE